MNNRGFAITTILYGILILFLFLLVSMMGFLGINKENLNKLIDNNNGTRDIVENRKCKVYLKNYYRDFNTNKIVVLDNIEEVTLYSNYAPKMDTIMETMGYKMGKYGYYNEKNEYKEFNSGTLLKIYGDITLYVSYCKNNICPELGGGSQSDKSKPYQELLLNGNGPVLDNAGMIPVTIDNSGNVKTVSVTDENWYSYEDKKWANAILVTESSRAKYLNKPNTPVTKSDILAYYVWIPKYSYKMNSSSGKGNEKEISISWNYNESGYTPHPAFKFNEGMTGFWVGKFETTGTATQPAILNNKLSLRSQTVSVQFTTSLLFAGGSMDSTSGNVTFSGSSTYGLSTVTDSHMMKNSEWGAVTYLSHSQYGINGEIRINNQRGYTTGCGAETADARSSSTCTLAYGSGISEYPQSTTGNITGVFDMSGGAYEYVMGNYNNTTKNSGFTTYPPTKYYDLYTITSTSSCTTETCGGHALNETSGWYGDYAIFVSSGSPWFKRGGDAYNGANAGAFYFGGYIGIASSYGTWRSVLAVG